MKRSRGSNVKRSIARPCHTCHCTTAPHTPDCPVPQLDKLIKRQRRNMCPVCNEQEVGVNAKDFWECRSCHTVFCSSGADCKQPKTTHIFDYKTGNNHFVYQFEGKGDGNFPVDKAIEKLRAIIRSSK